MHLLCPKFICVMPWCKLVAQVAMGEELAGDGDDDDEACDGDVAGARRG